MFVAICFITSEEESPVFKWNFLRNTNSSPVIPLFAAPKRISWTVQITLYVSLTGFLVFFIVSLAMSRHKQPGSFIVESGLGTSGWGGGTAWVLGITNAMYAFGGTDGGQSTRLVPPTIKLTLFSYPHQRGGFSTWPTRPSSDVHDHHYWLCYQLSSPSQFDVLHD